MDALVNLILNSSVTIVVICFFMYKELKYTATLQNTLQTLVDVVNSLKDSVKNTTDKEV